MTPETIAKLEMLRRAADSMRERTKAATPGPWMFGDDGLVWPDRIGDPVSGSTELADSVYIASWHPPVALAVADWLDAEHAYFSPIWDGPYVPAQLARALAVAGACLREESCDV